MLGRIAARRAELAEEAERLAKQLAGVEGELARFTAAEQVVAQLLAEDGQDGGVAVGTPVFGRAIPRRGEAELADLPDDYRLLAETVSAAGSPLRCKAVCEAAGLGTDSGPVEGARNKLRRLAERGWLRTTGNGMFAPL